MSCPASETTLADIIESAKFDAERAGAPGSRLRLRAMATMALVDEVRSLRARVAELEGLLKARPAGAGLRGERDADMKKEQ